MTKLERTSKQDPNFLKYSWKSSRNLPSILAQFDNRKNSLSIKNPHLFCLLDCSSAPRDSTQNFTRFNPKFQFNRIMDPSQKYLPVDWMGYFDQEVDIAIPDSDDEFHVYKAGLEGPVVFCLHGGGYSGLSFALAAAQIKEKAQVVAMDMRGHGKSITENDLDLSTETMCNDVLAVLKTMYGETPPAIVLVGHSMGGSVAIHVAAKRALPTLAGLVVVDVVEGTAMASLIHMQKILSNQMQHFPSIEKAIEWAIKGGTLRNLESARVSVPSTLKFDDSKGCYVHRARLAETEQYWRGWYEGLSEKFLACPVPKLLLLAGTDRLDRVLTIGQMQGKFQMVVVRHTGHAIQEDVPDEFASLILNFISRNRIGPHGIEIPVLRKPSQQS